MNRLGKILIVLSVFCFFVTSGLKIAMSGWMPFFYVGFGFGAFFLIFALAINIGYLIGLFYSEAIRFFIKSLGRIFLVLLVLFFINYIAAHKIGEVDITTNKIHSLSQLSQSLVKALPEDLSFYYFHTGTPQAQLFEKQVESTISRYKSLSPKVKFESHSLFKRPDLAKRFKTGDEESALFVEYKDRIERITDLTETEITNALLKLTKKAKTLYFLQNFDSRKIQDTSIFGLSEIKKQLERLHYQVKEISEISQVSGKEAILVIVGPRKKLTQQEELKAFLNQGGSALLALDPDEDHGLGSFLQDYGMQWTSHYIFSGSVQAGQSPLMVLTHRGQVQHEVSQKLQEGANPLLFISSSLQLLEFPTDEMRVLPILEHLPTSLGQRGIEAKSEVLARGRQFAGLVTESVKDPFYRLVVMADSDFMTNQFYNKSGNFDYILNLFAFLSKDEDLMRMKIPQAETTYLLLTQTQMKLYLLFFVLPFAFLFFIFALFFKLRRFF